MTTIPRHRVPATRQWYYRDIPLRATKTPTTTNTDARWPLSYRSVVMHNISFDRSIPPRWKNNDFCPPLSLSLSLCIYLKARIEFGFSICQRVNKLLLFNTYYYLSFIMTRTISIRRAPAKLLLFFVTRILFRSQTNSVVYRLYKQHCSTDTIRLDVPISYIRTSSTLNNYEWLQRNGRDATAGIHFPPVSAIKPTTVYCS